MVSIKDLTFTYSEETPVTVLNHINLEICDGEFVAVLGHNGSGKSTLAKHLNAILLPSGGKVYVDGMDTSDESKVWDIRSNAAMVFQNPDNQIVATVVEEDVAFAAENLGIPSDEIRTRVDEALDAVGMSDYRLHAPHLLSGGQKQRVAIAGMLAMEPECVIFDESTAMLDPKGRKDILETILKLRDKGITVVLITHYMNEAAMADEVLVVDHGKVIASGTPEEIFDQGDFLAAHRLEPPQAAALVQKLKKSGIDIRTRGVLDAKGAADAILEALAKKKHP